MKRLLRLWVATAAAVLATTAVGHAYLDRAVPAPGSVVHAPPMQLELWFTQPIEPAFSKVRVLDRSGKQVDRGDARVDPADAKRLRVSLPKVGPGRFRVVWRVLSVDTHVSEGHFTFDVAP